jgi:Na+/H+ antiporter NhaD/arsenite permease-like protein
LCTLLFAILTVLAALFYHKQERENPSTFERALALTAMARLYRHVTIDKTILYPAIAVFCLMFALWIMAGDLGLSPGVICFIGVGIFMMIKHEAAEQIIRHEIDFESILFLTALFLMVSCMAGSGILDDIAALLAKHFTNPKMLVCALMLVCGISTAIFSAGPSMATMLPIAQQIIARGDVAGDTVYIGLALSVCAGSSFLLTAATAGPLAQSLVEKSGLSTRDGDSATFNFMTFLPFGVVAYAVIQTGGLLFVLARL